MFLILELLPILLLVLLIFLFRSHRPSEVVTTFATENYSSFSGIVVLNESFDGRTSYYSENLELAFPGAFATSRMERESQALKNATHSQNELGYYISQRLPILRKGLGSLLTDKTLEFDLENISLDQMETVGGISVFKYSIMCSNFRRQFFLNLIPNHCEVRGHVVCFPGQNGSAHSLAGYGPEDYGRRIAQRYASLGFIVSIPLIPTSREGINGLSARLFVRGSNYWSYVNSLCCLIIEFISSKYNIRKTGLAGISIGGFSALLCAAVNDRINFIHVSGCLQNIFDRVISKREANDSIEPFFYLPNGFWETYDVDVLAAIIAPRTLVFEVGLQDKICKNYHEEYAKIEKCYGWHGASSSLCLLKHNGGHEFAESYGVDCIDKLTRIS